MLDKNNIAKIINDHQQEIDEIRYELSVTHTPHARKALENRISYLQAKAWGIEA